MALKKQEVLNMMETIMDESRIQKAEEYIDQQLSDLDVLRSAAKLYKGSKKRFTVVVDGVELNDREIIELTRRYQIGDWSEVYIKQEEDPRTGIRSMCITLVE